VKANPGPISGGMAPIYGAAGKMPDRGTVRELLVEFMDSSCWTDYGLWKTVAVLWFVCLYKVIIGRRGKSLRRYNHIYSWLQEVYDCISISEHACAMYHQAYKCRSVPIKHLLHFRCTHPVNQGIIITIIEKDLVARIRFQETTYVLSTKKRSLRR
jgi:hypothetical protein